MTDLVPVFRFVRRWWWLILLPALLIGAFTVATSLSVGALPPTYSAQFKYTAAQVESNVTPRDGDYQDVWLASEYTVNAFTEWIRSSTFREEIQALVPTANFGALGIETDNARSIGQVQMTYPDATTLQLIVDASLTVLETRNNVYFPHLGAQAAQVTLIDAPQITPVPPSLPNRFEPFIRIGIGLAIGILLALFFEFLDGSVRYPDDIERLGVKVVGKIPRV
jgi:capsular polysaccharide biosynthesis protein